MIRESDDVGRGVGRVLRAVAFGVLVCGLALLAVVFVAGPVWAQNAPAVIDAEAMAGEVESQMQGDYGDMQRDRSIPLGQIQDAWDNAAENAGVYNVPYHPEKVVRLRVRQHMTTTIVFPKWERIGDVYLGDDFVFAAEQTRPNILVARVSHAGADTSLTVVGADSGLVYTFYLRAVGVNADDVPDLTVRVLASKPAALVRSEMGEKRSAEQEAVSQAAKAAEAASKPVGADTDGTGVEDPDYLEPIPFDAGELRFDFTMTGDKSIAPERVFSDGVFTYFDYGDRWDRTDLPAVYRVVDGIDTPQNVRYRGSMIVVESAGAFTLRNGQRVVCVRPAGWKPATEGAKAEKADRPSAQERFANRGNDK